MSRMPLPCLPAVRGAALALALAASTLATGAIKPDSAAPDFTLRTMDGPNLRLKEQRGRVVMVNFWATWCGPCRQEMPHLERLHRKYRSTGLVMLGVNVDDDAKKAAELAAKLGVSFPMLFDPDKAVSKLYDLATMPSTVLIDRDGTVRFVHRGYFAGYEENYERQIRELLK